MTQEEIELLLKDLSARLPYNVLVLNKDGDVESFTWQELKEFEEGYMVKPYLRPMSSMTEEERKEWRVTFESVYDLVPGGNPDNEDDYDDNWHEEPGIESYDYLNAHHFDYRGLIEKGLALEAPEGVYDIKNK